MMKAADSIKLDHAALVGQLYSSPIGRVPV
jgi:hypothetical protein